MMINELSSLRKEVADVVRGVKPLLMDDYGKVGTYATKSQYSSGVVTELDQQVERYLKSRLEKIIPDAGFIGEEGGGNQDRATYWLVDPIDGTSHYVRGLPFCTTIVALIEDDEVVLSVIYNFVTDELFSSTKDGGALMNDVPIRASERSLSGSLLSHDIDMSKPEGLSYFARLSARTGGLFNSLNCGYELSMIACGKLDGKVFISPYAKQWDFAAGTLLIREAGGVVRNLGDNDFSLNSRNFYAVNSIISSELDDLFSSF